MGSVSVDWATSLAIDETDHKSSVSAAGTLTLTCGDSPPHSLSGAVMLKIGCTYYNAANTPIGMDGNPLPEGVEYSKYDSIASMGGGGNPFTATASVSNHDGGAYCRSSPPNGATKALYKYYAACNANTLCPGAGFVNQMGPSSLSAGLIVL